MLRRILATFLVLLLTACAPAEPPIPVATSLSDYYNQKLDWQTCGELKCAVVMVPIDWANPTDGAIYLHINWLASTGTADRGWLLENPGGPGASGMDFVAGGGDSVASAELRKHYNIVGFDPRGVQRSSPIKCYDSKGLDRILYDSWGVPGSQEDFDTTVSEMKKLTDACQKNSGKIFGFVDTVSAAKDLDVIRAALGEKKLNYLGFSYGTFLGNTYAALFPKKVGRFVLDGVVDPTVSDEQQSLNQLKAFDQSLQNYLADCLGNSDCPFKGTKQQAMNRIIALFKLMETNFLQTDDENRTLNASTAITGLIMSLYSKEYWEYLTEAFNQAFKDDGTMFLTLADAYNERNDDGSYANNTFEANLAISCLDSRSNPDMAAMEKQNAAALKLSPFLGRYWQYGALACSEWPFPLATRPKSYSAKGSGPILVVGTTSDPATPYWQAVNVATKILANGHLVTYNGEGHTAYGRSNACVVAAVDRYLIDGIVPSVDPNC